MKEMRLFYRFATVGFGVALLYVLLYMALVRVGCSYWWANLIAFLSATILQYFGQTFWTFRKPLAVPSQIGRFLTMVLVGLVVSALITNLLAPFFGFDDWVAAGLVALTLPALNYVALKLWVFNSNDVLDTFS